MNKIYCIAGATLMGVLLLLTLASCSKESQLTPEVQPEAGAGQIAFSLDNDALRSVPAEAYEKAVDEHSVWCVFVTPTGAGGAQTVQAAKQAHKTAAGSYSVNAGFSGAAQMFVIGNVESELQSKLYNLTSGTLLSEVQKWIVKNSLCLLYTSQQYSFTYRRRAAFVMNVSCVPWRQLDSLPMWCVPMPQSVVRR